MMFIAGFVLSGIRLIFSFGFLRSFIRTEFRFIPSSPPDSFGEVGFHAAEDSSDESFKLVDNSDS